MDLSTEMAVEANKRKLGEGNNLELIQKVEALEQMSAVEAKKQKLREREILELSQKIAVLEREKEQRACHLLRENEALQDKVSKLTKKSEELEKSLCEKRKETEKLTKRIEALGEEKREMEAKVCSENREKNAEILSMVKENVALKEKVEEMRKEWTDRDDVIKVLQQEVETLEARIKGLETKNVRLVLKMEEEDGEILHVAAAQKNQGRSLNETSKRMKLQKWRDN